MTQPSTVPTVARLLAAYHQSDALGIHQAVKDAQAQGITPSSLIVALTGTLAGVLAESGTDLARTPQQFLVLLASGKASAS